jgi:hypothetical protein
MKTYLCKFYGRKSGALGICYWIEGVEVKSENDSEKIKLAVYEAGYEEVSRLTYMENNHT